MSQTPEPYLALETTASDPTPLQRFSKTCAVAIGLSLIHLLATLLFCLITGKVSQQYLVIFAERELLLPATSQLLVLFFEKLYYYGTILLFAIILIDTPVMLGLQYLSEKKRWISRLWFTSFPVFMVAFSGLILFLLSESLANLSTTYPPIAERNSEEPAVKQIAKATTVMPEIVKPKTVKPEVEETPAEHKPEEPVVWPKVEEPSVKPNTNEPIVKPQPEETPAEPKIVGPVVIPKIEIPKINIPTIKLPNLNQSKIKLPRVVIPSVDPNRNIPPYEPKPEVPTPDSTAKIPLVEPKVEIPTPEPMPEEPGAEGEPTPYADLPDGKSIYHRVLVGEADETGWCVADSTRGNFSVELPAPFTDSMTKLATTTYGIRVFHTVTSKVVGQPEYHALQTEMISKRKVSAQVFVNRIVKGLESKGTTVTRSDLTLGNLPGERLSMRTKVASAEMALASSATSDYQVLIEWNSTTAEPTEEEIERFFSSFKIAEPQK
ncbi:MAG: hypothetical protein COA78_37610 [Blastopirellula sp.]|nr:MAG: hypothetical protein COA78_37610 [Blastopirellula sp.]